MCDCGGEPLKHLSVRNLSPELGRALDEERRRRGTSLNQTVIDLLSEGLGVGSAVPRRNDLARLAGTWSAEEHARFDAAIASLERVDPDLWQ